MNIQQILQQGTILSETHMVDSYPPAFHEFRAKYLKLKENKHLFVNFTNFAGDAIDKTFSQTPDHKDPIGLYAYPLKYIIDHPMDVRYGRSAKYMRVIEYTGDRALYLQYLSESEMHSIFWRAKKINFRDNIKTFKRAFPTGTSLQRIWFSTIQSTVESLNNLIEFYSKPANKKIQFRLDGMAGAEQTAMFTALGYDAIIDTASNDKKAAINPWEPEQAIFLKRGAFIVKEVFTLNHNRDNSSLVGVSSEQSQTMMRKMAADIASGIGDKLMSSKAIVANMMGAFNFLTVAGRQIIISEEDTVIRDFSTLGQKKHKEAKTYDMKAIKVRIISEKKTVEFTSDVKDKFDTIAALVIRKWKAEQDENPDFVPIKTEQEFNTHQQVLRAKHLNSKNNERLIASDIPEEVTQNLQSEFAISNNAVDEQTFKFAVQNISSLVSMINARMKVFNMRRDEDTEQEYTEVSKFLKDGAFTKNESGVYYPGLKYVDESVNKSEVLALTNKFLDKITSSPEQFDRNFNHAAKRTRSSYGYADFSPYSDIFWFFDDEK